MMRNLIREFTENPYMSPMRVPGSTRAPRTFDNDWIYKLSIPKETLAKEGIAEIPGSGIYLIFRREAARELQSTLVITSSSRGAQQIILLQDQSLGQIYDFAQLLQSRPDAIGQIIAAYRSELKLPTQAEYERQSEEYTKSKILAESLAIQDARRNAQEAPLTVEGGRVVSVSPEARERRIQAADAKEAATRIRREARKLVKGGDDVDLAQMMKDMFTEFGQEATKKAIAAEIRAQEARIKAMSDRVSDMKHKALIKKVKG